MKKYISIILLTFIIANSSCKKDFLSLENNPNSPSQASANLLLASALKTSAGIVNNAVSTGSYDFYTQYACWMGYLSWSTGYQANTALEQYLLTSSTYDIWTPLYLNLANYNALIKSNPGPYYVGIAKIMTVYNFEALVDNYNNVPYTQAFLGTANLTPAYDDASTIYDNLMTQLDLAISTINAELNNANSTAVNPGSGDIVYAGNMLNWVKFANTLKLKLAIRQSNISAKTSALKAKVAATASLGYIDASNPAVANPGYTNSDVNGGQQSPMFIAYGTTAAGSNSGVGATYQANAYGAHFYGKNSDPRLIQVYSASTDSKALFTKGVFNATNVAECSIDYLPGDTVNVVVSSPFGDATNPRAIYGTHKSVTNISPSKFGPGVLKSPTQNANILSAAESLFLQAEGVAAGYITGDAASLYKAAITASFVDDGVPNATAAAATYVAQPAIAYPTGGTFAQQQKAIIVQKWAALNLYGAFEAFNEFRRTGYPDDIPLSVYPNSNAPNQITRIPYPYVEYSTNPVNVAKNVSNASTGSVDIFHDKIFWAK